MHNIYNYTYNRSGIDYKVDFDIEYSKRNVAAIWIDPREPVIHRSKICGFEFTGFAT